MGNTNNINERPFRIILSKKSFLTNESITGEIIIEPTQTLVLSDVVIRLKKFERWSLKIGKSTTHESNSQILLEIPLNIGLLLGSSQTNKTLLQGQYHFPFSFPIIHNLQPTFEFLYTTIHNSSRSSFFIFFFKS